MKTLDEVIKAYEICLNINETSCRDCPYTEFNAVGKWACSLCGDCTEDALHYLTEYKHTRQDLLDGMKRLEGKELMYIHALANLEDNPPLTFEELREMVGKPVWVETDNAKFWTIVDNFRIICNQECLCCSKGYMCRSTYMRGDWQAYRKERL